MVAQDHAHDDLWHETVIETVIEMVIETVIRMAPLHRSVLPNLRKKQQYLQDFMIRRLIRMAASRLRYQRPCGQTNPNKISISCISTSMDILDETQKTLLNI